MDGLIIVIGGESTADFRMHTEVEALNPATMRDRPGKALVTNVYELFSPEP